MSSTQLGRVERFAAPIRYEHIIAESRAWLRCGCSVFVGERVGDEGVDAVARPCMQPHRRLTRLAMEILSEEDGPVTPERAAQALSYASSQVRPRTKEED